MLKVRFRDFLSRIEFVQQKSIEEKFICGSVQYLTCQTEAF